MTIPISADKVAAGYYVDQDIDPERIWNLYLVGYTFTDGQPVAISYAAGYVQPGTTGPLTQGQVALPGDIEQAVLDWCAYRYKERPKRRRDCSPIDRRRISRNGAGRRSSECAPGDRAL